MTSTAPSVKRVTAADVARSLGISRATVGFVLNDTPGQTISEATRARVLDEAKRLGYRANTAARALASGRSRIILLVLPDWPLDYAMRTHLDEASLALDEAGYALVTMTPHPGGQAQPLWETLRPDVVMGMAPFTVEQLESIRASGVEHVIPPQPARGTRRRRSAGIRRRTPPAGGAPALAAGDVRLAFARSADPRVADLVTQRKARADAALQDASAGAFLADDAVTEETAGRPCRAVDGSRRRRSRRLQRRHRGDGRRRGRASRHPRPRRPRRDRTRRHSPRPTLRARALERAHRHRGPRSLPRRTRAQCRHRRTRAARGSGNRRPPGRARNHLTVSCRFAMPAAVAQGEE